MRRRRPGDGHARRAPELTLAAHAQRLAAEWGLELGQPFPLALHSFAAPAGNAVIKAVSEDHVEPEHEGDALAHWDGDGAVRLLRRAGRVLLLERARPGTDISALPDEEATAIAVEVGLRLWRPAGEPFRWVGDWLPRWLDEEPNELTPVARGLLASLEPRRDTLVHGDFHHHNILASARGHLAIDPQPFLAEPEFDVPTFLWNPLPCRLRVEHLERRLAAFVAAGLDEERIRKWTVIRGAYLQPQEAKALLGLL